MVISMEFARSLCLKIHGKRRSRIQFLDGSQALTEGTVRAKWQFGSQETPVYHEFHVLKGLPVSAILSSGVLDEFDVFRRYAHRIGSAESISSKGWQDPSGMGIFGISLVKRCEEEIKSLSDSFLDDITSDNPFTPEKIERERARRDEIRDTIAKIP
ncbi:hypothetical protein COL922a_011119 [Colletotrichum nupharicola]|nr:hypothetical protein COL922a_011119 [Colletotrichum nupharicola]